jgi:pimeloyl-ACP methyl ester carboxylesterase/photosystem II stability/assembly factor-like uncharacterized protein
MNSYRTSLPELLVLFLLFLSITNPALSAAFNADNRSVSYDAVAITEEVKNSNLKDETLIKTRQYFSDVITGDRGLKIAVGNGPVISLSRDKGKTWIQQKLPTDLRGELYAIIYNKGQYITVGTNKNSEDHQLLILTSPDGINWTQQAKGITTALNQSYLNGISYNGKEYVAVGSTGSANNPTILILKSLDGNSWSRAITPITEGMLMGIAYDKRQYVAVGSHGIIPIVLTSPDAVTWTEQKTLENNGMLLGVTYGKGQYVAVGFDALKQMSLVLTSLDGIVWKQQNGISSIVLSRILYSGSQYITVGVAANPEITSSSPALNTPAILMSSDGVTWTRQQSPALDFRGEIRGINYSEGVYIAVGRQDPSDVAPLVLTSPDGINWEHQIARITQDPLAKLSSSNTIDWKPCPDFPSFDCGLLTVPIDYQNPGLGSIRLPVTIHRVQPGTNKLGTLFINFGGPWGDNVRHLHGMLPFFTATVQNQYDLVTFAPRGIAPNEISCHTRNRSALNEIQRRLFLTDMNSETGAQALYEGTLQKRQLCTYGNLAQYAGTKNTLQDMEQLRQALPQVGKIDYLGYSYGTRLGLAYLLQYPNRVEKMVLDSNASPNNDLKDFTHSYASAMEGGLQAFFQFCAASSLAQCALYEKTPEKIKQKYQAFVNRTLEIGGLPTSASYSHRPFSLAMLASVVSGGIRSPRDWPNIAKLLQESIVTQKGDTLMSVYINNTGYIPATNSYEFYDYYEVSSVVLSKDYNHFGFCDNLSQWLGNMNILRHQYPLLGAMFIVPLMGDTCIASPQESDPLLPKNPAALINAPPILIINNRYDTSTPLSSALALSQYLTHLAVPNKILEWEGVGHGSYAMLAPRDGCINTNVDYFFATGQFPTTRVCNDKINPFIDYYQQSPVKIT